MICKKCKSDKEPESFHNDSSRPSGKHPYCKNCQNGVNKVVLKAWRKRNSIKTRAQKLRYKYKNGTKYYKSIRNQHLKTNYGIDIETYDKLLASQGGVCAICKRPPPNNRRLAVDHCHSTKKVRGILCSTCNSSLGGFKDSIPLLIAAIDYLKGLL